MFSQRKRIAMSEEITLSFLMYLEFEKFRRVFSKYNIPVCFKPMKTLRQHLVHPKGWIPKHLKSNIVYAVNCSEECEEIYVEETKELLNRRMSQHRPPNSLETTQQCIHTHQKKHSFHEHEVHILKYTGKYEVHGEAMA